MGKLHIRIPELEALQLQTSSATALQSVIRAAMSYVESIKDGDPEGAEYWEDSLAFWCREVALESKVQTQY